MNIDKLNWLTTFSVHTNTRFHQYLLSVLGEEAYR
jgi:hypothetical protein